MKIDTYEFKPTGVDGIYVCEEAIFKAPFDKEGSNVWEYSSGKKMLEQWFKEHAPTEIQEQFDIDLPTVEEVFSHKTLKLYSFGRKLVSEQFPIFKDSDERMKEFNGEPILWFTRSVYSGYDHAVWRVSVGGGIGTSDAGYESWFVPVLRRKWND